LFHIKGINNGDSSGGTFNAITYAKKLGKLIRIIDPRMAKNKNNIA
jgi:hypothetical protein